MRKKCFKNMSGKDTIMQNKYLVTYTYTDEHIEHKIFEDFRDAHKSMIFASKDYNKSYKNIALLTDLKATTPTVLEIIPFQNGLAEKIISLGSIVRIKENFLEKGEPDYTYVVTNINEVSERINICHRDFNFAIKATETVGVNMVKVEWRNPIHDIVRDFEN